MQLLDKSKSAWLLVGFFISLFSLSNVFAAPAAPNVNQTFIQADGSEVILRLWGDEYVHGWETQDGFTAIHNPATGYWDFAVRDKTGHLKSSGLPLNSDAEPASAHLRPTAVAQNEIRAASGAPALGDTVANVPPPFGTGTSKVLFIMVAFSDEACTFTDAQMQANLFGGAATGPGDLDDYFREVSYGKLNMVGTVEGGVAGCYTLPDTQSTYDNTPNNDEKLVKDAVDLANADVDFSDYDNDGNGLVDVLGIIYAGGGAHDGCDAAADDELWPHSSGLGTDKAVDGVAVRNFIIQSEITYAISDFVCDEMQTIGLFAHEFGHAIGIPDLYDTDDSSSGIHKWSTMASQYVSTVNLADTPPHYDAWSKSFEGWTTPVDMTTHSGEVVLGQASETDDVIRLLPNDGGVETNALPGGDNEYFLLENRQQTGFDAGLAGCGVLIWHIDEEKGGNQLEGHDAVNHRLVDLEEADGLDELDGTGAADAGDPYPGSTNNQLFGELSLNPNSLLYDGSAADTEVRAANFSECLPAMSFNIGEPRADVSISKTDTPDPVLAGEYLTYNFNVRNFGPGVATGVTVTDTLPAGVSYETDTDSCVDAPTGTLTCDLGDILDNDSKQFSVLVKVDSDLVAINDGPTALSNSASVEAEQPDDDLTNNIDTAETIVLESADLAISKQCKPDTSPVQAGGNGTCYIYVDNVGPSAARNVVVTDSIDSDGIFELVSASMSVINNGVLDAIGVCSPSNQNPVNQHINVICDRFDLDAGARATITVVVSSDEAGDINDIATVTSDTPDPVFGNNQADGSLSFAAETDLGLTKSDLPDPVVAGEQLTYELIVTNHGPSTAVNVVVSDNLPAGVSIVSVAATGGGACNAGVPGDASQPTICAFDSLAKDASETMTIVVTVLPQTTGVLHNDAEVTADTADSDTSNNYATEKTVVDAIADLAVTKVDAPDPALAGGNVSYTLEVVNGGPSTAIDVVLTDTLPPEVSFLGYTVLDGSGACAENAPNFITCEAGNLNPGEMFTVVIDVLVDASVPDGTTIYNAAVVSSQTFDSDTGNNSVTVDTLINTAADLWIDKTSNWPTGSASSTINYFLTVHNDSGCSDEDPLVCGEGGPSDALNVVVVDQLPVLGKKKEPISIVFISEDCVISDVLQITCTTAVLPAGATVIHEIHIQYAGKIDTLLNTVSVATDTDDPVSGNNEDTLEITVKGGSDRNGGPGGGRGKGPK